MATTNLDLATPANGSEVDTWDVPVNANSGKLDACAGSVTTKSLTNVNVTLTATESRVNILRFTGTLTGNVQITLGAIIKSWVVDNQTVGNFVITVTGGSGNVVGLPDGRCQIVWDGTNVFFFNLGVLGQYCDDSGAAVPAWISACTVPPALVCDGSSFSAVTYPVLNKKLGGNTLPDQRGRFRAALDGGTSRITTAGGSVDGATRLASGGAQNRTIGQANFPNVNFTVTIPSGQGSHQHTIGGGATQYVDFVGAGGSFNLTAGGNGFSRANNDLATLPAMTGTAASGGSATALQTLPPTLIGGVTMIWAV